jgi:hypothetical protein
LIEPANASYGDGKPQGEAREEIYEEVVLLDSAGRLQVPRDLLVQTNIKGRVQLELVEGGILIRPARATPSGRIERKSIDEPAGLIETHGLQSWWKRVRGENRGRRLE